MRTLILSLAVLPFVASVVCSCSPEAVQRRQDALNRMQATQAEKWRIRGESMDRRHSEWFDSVTRSD